MCRHVLSGSGGEEGASPRRVNEPLKAARVISPPLGARERLAAGATDMRRGFDGLARQVVQGARTVAITAAQFSMLVEGVNCRMPAHTGARSTGSTTDAMTRTEWAGRADSYAIPPTPVISAHV